MTWLFAGTPAPLDLGPGFLVCLLAQIASVATQRKVPQSQHKIIVHGRDIVQHECCMTVAR
jgi:hypothetical protein